MLMFMVLFLIVCLVALVWIVGSDLRLRADVNPVKLGWMSERWLMEYRASHWK